MNLIAKTDVPDETKQELHAACMQKGYKYRFEWWADGAEAIAEEDAAAVVIDVLSFTSAVDVAVSRGAEIIPFNSNDSGIEDLAKKLGATIALKRGHGPITLSPPSMENAQKGQKIILRSQNGAILTLVAKHRYKTIIAASLRNARAVAMALARLKPKVVCIIAGGEKWDSGATRMSLEDMLGAGAVLSHFDMAEMSPEAKAAVHVFLGVKDFHKELSECSSGRELIAKGYADDVKYASMLNASSSVPFFLDGTYKNKA